MSRDSATYPLKKVSPNVLTQNVPGCLASVFTASARANGFDLLVLLVVTGQGSPATWSDVQGDFRSGHTNLIICVSTTDRGWDGQNRGLSRPWGEPSESLFVGKSWRPKAWERDAERKSAGWSDGPVTEGFHWGQLGIHLQTAANGIAIKSSE